MTEDLMKVQLVQGLVTTRSVPILGSESVTVSLHLAQPAPPALAVAAELQGLFDRTWLPLADATFPGPPVAGRGDTAERVRLVLELSEPASVGATITY